LLAAGDVVRVLCDADLGQRAHRLVGVGVVQTVEGQVVHQRRVAVFVPVARLRQQVWGLAHGFHATGDDGVEGAGADQLIGKDTDSMPDRHTLLTLSAGVAMGIPALVAGLAGRHLPASSGKHLPQNDVLHLCGGNVGLLQCRSDGGGAEVDADSEAKEPFSRPMGARAPATITELFIVSVLSCALARDYSLEPSS
jgi:hypothetical protein